jgi:hypothetical protein
MPSIRTTERSVYSALSTSAAAQPVRAQADRYTVTGSVACSATSARAASVTDAAGPASSCRCVSRARRWAVLTFTVMAGNLPAGSDTGEEAPVVG